MYVANIGYPDFHVRVQFNPRAGTLFLQPQFCLSELSDPDTREQVIDFANDLAVNTMSTHFDEVFIEPPVALDSIQEVRYRTINGLSKWLEECVDAEARASDWRRP